MDDLEYTTRLGGMLAAQQILLVRICQKVGVTQTDIDELMAKYRYQIADRDIRNNSTSNIHWDGFQEAMNAIRQVLPDSRGYPDERTSP